jgi:asparagine synthase (glutamine-hydrolysing)
MNALVGWYNCPIGPAEPAAVAAAMLDARPFAQRERRSAADRVAALALDGAPRSIALASDEKHSVAILGRPRWDHSDLAAIARERGHGEALLEAYRRTGDGFLARLRGSFALAILDRAGDRAVIAIDRYGIETMCYATPAAGGLVFGSTTDCVRAHPAISATIAPQSLFNYLYFSVCPSPATIYREQRKLQPAEVLVFERGAVRTGFYWQAPYRERTDKDLRTLSAEMMEHLRAAVGRIVADEDGATMGAFLSGGLDSSTVAGLLANASGGKAKTFTIGFAQEKYDESPYADIAAGHFKTDQHLYRLTPGDVARSIGRLSAAFDEPFGNSSVLPAYYCAAMARENGVSIMLAGDGGDEIFGGNSRYVEELILDLYQFVPGLLRHRVLEPMLLNAAGLDKWAPGRKARNYVRRARIPMPDRTQRHNFYYGADLADIIDPELLCAIDAEEPLAGLREVYERTGSSAILQRMMHLDLKLTLADNDLRKVGVACALAEMPVAFPFLDDDVVEFAASVPPDLLIRRLEKRWFYKQAVSDFLPAATLQKRKHGFGMPFSEWPRENPELHEMARDCLAGLSRRHYLAQDFLDRLGRDDGGPEADGLIWDLMVLELWLRDRETRAQGNQSQKFR